MWDETGASGEHVNSMQAAPEVNGGELAALLVVLLNCPLPVIFTPGRSIMTSKAVHPSQNSVQINGIEYKIGCSR